MTRRSFTLRMLTAIGLASCNRRAPLANGRESADALARAVLEAVAGNDRSALEALAISEQEFRDHVWPHLPAARPERNLPFSYVWGDLRQKSQSGLSGTLAERAGQTYVFRRITFAGVTTYPDATVHRQATIQVDDSTGESLDLQVCGSMLEQDGTWKVFSYVVD